MPDAQRFEEARHHVVCSDRCHELGHGPPVEMPGDRLEQRVRHLHVACHRVGQGEDRFLESSEGFVDLRQLERSELFLGHARVPGHGKMRRKFERSTIQNRHPQDHHLAQIGWEGAAVADRGKQLFPALGQRRTVEQRLVKRGDVSALGSDRLLDRTQLRTGARFNQRNAGSGAHSPLIFLSWMIRPHLAVSVLTSAASSPGLDGTGSAPDSSNLFRYDSDVRTRRTAAWSCSMRAGGVLAGANSAYQLFDSTPCIPCSSKVRTSGSSGCRDGAAIPSGLRRPPFTNPIRSGISPKNPLTCPPMTSVIAGAAPLYGTCISLAPLESASSSIARCGMLPIPDDAMGIGFGLCLDCATRSVTLVAGFVGFTTSTSTLLTTSDTGAKSRCTS